MLLTLLLYDENGVVYESSAKKTIERFTISTLPETFEIASSVENIVGGTETVYSAFYNCRNGITNITFRRGSKLNSIGCHLFDTTSIVSCDMSNCESLTLIPEATFRCCFSLVNIILPPNLIKIGCPAITRTKITHLDIPDSVVTLGEWTNEGTFGYNTLLKSVSISPNSKIETIGAHAFMGTSIESFFFPRKLKEFPACPFVFSTGVKKYDVDELNEHFSVDSKKITILNKDKTEIVSVVNGIDGKYVVDKAVTKIKYHAFRDTKFTEIDLSQANITTVEQYAFTNSKVLELSFNEGLVSIDGWAFQNNKLVNISLPESLKNLNDHAFTDASNLKNIKLPSKITTIGNQAFSGCKSLTYIEIPASVTTFGSSVFGNCDPKLRVVFLNESRFVIKDNAVYFENRTLSDYFGTDKDAELTIPSFCNVIPARIFESKQLKSVSFEENMQSLTIGEKAFYKSSISSITFPSCLSSIGASCFYDCSKLTTISFEGTGVKAIPDSCFYSCTNLKTVIFNCDSITKIKQYAFYDAGIETIDLRNTALSTIEKYAFSKSKIISIDLPSTLKTIGLHAFSESSLQAITFDSGTIIETIDMFAFYKCASLTSAPLCDSLNILTENTFTQCTNLEHFDLPVNLTTLKMYSLSKCVSLTDITIKNNSNLQRIEPFAFEGCNRLKNFIILDKDNFFFDSSALMNSNRTKLIYYLASSKSPVIVLAGSIIEISQYAFQSCVSLHEVIIPNGALQKIGFMAFQNCSSLTRIVLPESLNTISTDAFKGCDKLKCGCTKVPEHLIDQAIKSGMPSYVLTDTCLSTDCTITFGKCTIACNNKRKMHTTSIFLVVIITSSKN